MVVDKRRTANAPQSINEDPMARADCCGMEMINSAEDLKALLDAAGYTKLLAEEA